MNLSEFIPLTKNSGGKYITITKSGIITLSQELVQHLNVQDGTCLKFFSNDDKPSDWYFGISKEGFKIRTSSTNSKIFSCSSLRKRMIQSLKLQDITFRMYLGQATRHEGAIVYILDFKGKP